MGLDKWNQAKNSPMAALFVIADELRMTSEKLGRGAATQKAELLGISDPATIALLEQGSKALKEQMDLAGRSGLVQSPEQLERMVKVHVQISEFWLKMKVWAVEFLSAYEPQIEKVIVKIQAWIKTHHDLIPSFETLAKWIEYVFIFLVAGKIISILGNFAIVLNSVFALLGAFGLGGGVAVIAALTAIGIAVIALTGNWDDLEKAVGGALDKMELYYEKHPFLKKALERARSADEIMADNMERARNED
jgi:hypothetical protein